MEGLLADTERQLIEAYGVWVEKSMYGRKYMGIERATFLIDGTARAGIEAPRVPQGGESSVAPRCPTLT